MDHICYEGPILLVRFLSFHCALVLERKGLEIGLLRAHLFGHRLKSSQIGETFITIFLKCANLRRVLGNYYFINLCVSTIYEAGQKDSQVHSYNENLQSTFFENVEMQFCHVFNLAG